LKHGFGKIGTEKNARGSYSVFVAEKRHILVFILSIFGHVNRQTDICKTRIWRDLWIRKSTMPCQVAQKLSKISDSHATHTESFLPVNFICQDAGGDFSFFLFFEDFFILVNTVLKEF
jgi:hypothetical protein